MEEFLTCPLTKQIYYNPVVAEDGYTYESIAFKDWVKYNKKSPVTGESIRSLTIPNRRMKEIVEIYLEENPDNRTKQFMFKKIYHYFRDEFISSLNAGRYEELYNFSHFLINDQVVYCNGRKKQVDTIVSYLSKHCKDKDVFNYIIDNALDYDSYDPNMFKPIHVLINYDIVESVKHLIGKGIDLNSKDPFGRTPLHAIIVKDLDPEILKMFIDNGADATITDRFDKTPLNYLLSMQVPHKHIQE